MLKHGSTLEVDGDTWSVVAVGATVDGETYVHLASKTRGTKQRNGFNPIQVVGWFDPIAKTLRS